MNRERMLHWAELVDSYRVFPRLFLAICLTWTINLSYVLLNWYFALPATSRGIEASGFASVVFLGAMAFLKLVYQTYSDAGRDWNRQPTVSSATVVSTTTTTPAP